MIYVWICLLKNCCHNIFFIRGILITESRCVNSVSFCQQMTLNFGEEINDFIRMIIILALAGEVVERCLFLHGGGVNSDIIIQVVMV